MRREIRGFMMVLNSFRKFRSVISLLIGGGVCEVGGRPTVTLAYECLVVLMGVC